jgi:1-acyl-sn-glycerol-3-phosphate acyltransferase
LIDRVITFFYWLNVKTWVSALRLVTVSLTFKDKERIPRNGALIVVSNHLNNADPLVLTAILPRRIVWMTKKEWFDTPVVGSLFHLFGLIPVRRYEADLKALRRAQQALEKGQVLGMFPEGTRSKTATLAEGEPGTAVIALRTGVPVLPVAIWGTENISLPRDFFRRHKFSVQVGEAFRLETTGRLTKERVASATREIMERVADLLPEKYRGVYAEGPARAHAATKAD